jgi:ATP-dependent Clp protease ATP-binding subunit ClpC
MGVLDKFTKRAKQVLSLAQEEARHFNHPYVGTEHILLGLIRDREGVAGKVLDDLGVKHAQARSAVEFIVGHGEEADRGEDLELTAGGKKVIEYALEEGRKLNHHYVGTEHLLLGLVGKSESIAAGVLEIMGVNLEQVRTSVLRELRRGPSSGMERTAQLKQSKTPYLDALSTDMTEMAEFGKLDPIIGRSKEIERMIQILSRRTKNSPTLIGASGVGKTALVKGLAQRIIAGDVPDSIKGKRIVTLDVAAFVAGIKQIGQFEERLTRVINEIKEAQCILFIDEFHLLLITESTLKAADIIKPVLSRGEIQVICVTTIDEYRKYIERDPVLERAFQALIVNEPSIQDTIEILRGIKSRYEDFHQLQILDDALNAAAHLSAQYIRDRFLPDKALDIIDEAASRVRMYRSPTPPALRDAMRGLEAIHKELNAAIGDRQADIARVLQECAERMQNRVKKIESEELTSNGSNYYHPYVTAEDVAEVVTMWNDAHVHVSAGNKEESFIPLESPTPTVVVTPPPLDKKPEERANLSARKPLRIFYSYSHRDRRLREQLQTHLHILKRQGYIEEWHDREIRAGQEWKEAIDDNLKSADIILLLISANFLASDYCYDEEMHQALERHKAKQARVIPIILQPVELQHSPFGHLQALPTNAKPVTQWSKRENAWSDVARGIREAVEQFLTERQSSSNL